MPRDVGIPKSNTVKLGFMSAAGPVTVACYNCYLPYVGI
jgi:hypothetical protein